MCARLGHQGGLVRGGGACEHSKPASTASALTNSPPRALLTLTSILDLTLCRPLSPSLTSKEVRCFIGCDGAAKSCGALALQQASNTDSSTVTLG